MYPMLTNYGWWHDRCRVGVAVSKMRGDSINPVKLYSRIAVLVAVATNGLTKFQDILGCFL